MMIDTEVPNRLVGSKNGDTEVTPHDGTRYDRNAVMAGPIDLVLDFLSIGLGIHPMIHGWLRWMWCAILFLPSLFFVIPGLLVYLLLSPRATSDLSARFRTTILGTGYVRSRVTILVFRLYLFTRGMIFSPLFALGWATSGMKRFVVNLVHFIGIVAHASYSIGSSFVKFLTPWGWSSRYIQDHADIYKADRALFWQIREARDRSIEQSTPPSD